MVKRKTGEKEAIIILKTIGIQLNEDYYDDNSRSSMPDLRYADGRGIEVTHTRHNNAIKKDLNKYQKALANDKSDNPFRRQLEIELLCSEALRRIHKIDYERNIDGKLTEEGSRLFKKDCEVLKKHMGYNPMERDLEKKFSEFECDCPSIQYSIDNILREITKDKGEKHKGGDTDLFLFVTIEEYDILKELLLQIGWNGNTAVFINQVIASPFLNVFICEWDFDKQEYNTENPRMLKFYKDAKNVKLTCYNDSMEKTKDSFY